MASVPVVVLANEINEKINILTGGKPTSLLRIVGKHIAEYTLMSLIDVGVSRVLMVVDDVEHFEDIAVKYGKRLEFDFLQCRSPRIEDSIILLRDYLKSDFILLYGNVIAHSDMYRELLQTYSEGKYSAVLVPEEDTEAYIVVKLADTRSIEMFTSGFGSSGTEGFYIAGGAYALPKEFIDLVESHGSIVKALNEINVKYKLRPCIWSGWWIGVVYPWDLLRASLYLLHQISKSLISSSAKISHRAVIEGPVIIEDNVEVDHYAVVRGPVYIGEGSYIGNHSLIRNYVSLEGGNTIGSYVEIVWSIIQRGTSVGSRSYIGFSVVGEDSVIEPGVVTLNIVPERVKIARAIRTERRGREYTKLGAVIGTKVRVEAYRVLRPGEVVAENPKERCSGQVMQ